MNVPNSESFVHAYTRACESRQTSFQSHLLSPALQTLKHLLVDSDRIKREEDWDPLIKGIKANRDLQRISIISDIGQTDPEVKVESKASTSKLIQSGSRSVNHQSPARVRALRLPAVALLSRISCFLASALRDCLQGSYALTVLELSGINLSEKEMKMISVGLFGSKSLRELSLARSHIGDEGLRVISRGIKAAKLLIKLNLSDCKLSWRGASIVAELLKSQAVQRQAAQWETTLRRPDLSLYAHFPPPHVSAERSSPHGQLSPSFLPAPIQHVNLSCNKIGDTGVVELLEPLDEDIGLTVLELQNCHITDVGGGFVERKLRYNNELLIVDLRNNTVDPNLFNRICSKLYLNLLSTIVVNGDQGNVIGPPSYPEWMAEGDPLASTYFKNISKGQWYDCGHKTHTESSLKKLRFGPPTRESDCSKTSSMKYRVGATKRSTITKSVEHPIKQDISPKHAYGQKGSNLLKRAAWIRETEHQTGNGRDSGGPTATEESRPSFSDSSPGLPTILPFHEPETEMAGEQLSPLEVAQFYLTSGGAGGSPTLQRIPHVGVSTEDSDSESLLGSPVMFL